MKIGKDEVFAIIESGLFLIGAVFLSIVFIDESNPLWALWIGLAFAGVGVLLWLRPLFFKSKKNKKNIEEEIPVVYEPYRPTPSADQDKPEKISDTNNDDSDSKINLDW